MSANTYPRRADFGDPEDYARAMAAHGPRSADDLDRFVGLAGCAGAVQRAQWGTHAEREAESRAEVRAEARARWFLFIDKIPARASSPSMGTVQPGSTLLGEAAVGEIFAASEFAREKVGPLDWSVTLCPKLVGATSAAEVEAVLGRYQKNLKQFLRDSALPCAFVGVVENSASIGLHLHFALHAPLARRARLKAWHEKHLRGEAARRGVDYDPAVVQFSRHRKHHPLLQDMLVSYMLKGADHRVVVQPARASLDGRDVLLRDLTAHAFTDPGVVPFDRLIIGPALAKAARGPWRSAWERGARRVDGLYGRDFVHFVQRRSRVVAMPSRTEALALLAGADALFAAVALAAGWQDFAVEATVANAEMVAQHVDRLAHDIVAFESAEFGVPQRVALETLRLSVRATMQAVAAAGERAVAIVLAGAVPGALANAVARALGQVEEEVRAVATRLGEPAAAPRWVLQLLCAQLQRV